MKKLALQRETVRVLGHMELGHIHGGGLIANPQTTQCRIGTGGACSGGSCVETTVTSGSIVINPGLPSGG